MDGIFGVASKNNYTLNSSFGVDYHSRLGAKRSRTVVYGNQDFTRSVHNTENTPFRTKFDGNLDELEGILRIGYISDTEPQPLLIQSRLGSFAIITVGKINNEAELVTSAYGNGHIRLMEMNHGCISATELAAVLTNQGSTLVEGLLYAQEKMGGSVPILLLTPEGIYAPGGKFGRTPIIIGREGDAYCAFFESFAYINLRHTDYKELRSGKIIYMTPESAETVSPPREEMKICSFLRVYYGYPTSSYEGINVRNMRYECGKLLTKRNDTQSEVVADVSDSGIAHTVEYANESGIPFTRPFVKYTPTRPRSFTSQNQGQGNLVVRMKLVPVDAPARGKKLLLIDDSIVRGTQLSETTEFLYHSGAKEVHIHPACPPLMFGCPYLNFFRSTSKPDLIARRITRNREDDGVPQGVLNTYMDPNDANCEEMTGEIRKRLGPATLRYHRLDDLVKSVGISPCKLHTYCWSGRKQKDFTRESGIAERHGRR